MGTPKILGQGTSIEIVRSMLFEQRLVVIGLRNFFEPSLLLRYVCSNRFLPVLLPLVSTNLMGRNGEQEIEQGTGGYATRLLRISYWC